MTHVPVMTAEVLQHLRPEQGGLFVDCTVGLGGHSRALLEAGATRVIGFDRDPDALARARETLAPWGDRVELVHADYRAIDAVLDQRRIDRIDGALADLGVSSMQFDAPGRGFSFQRDEPLDMRMDRTTGDTAADLVARSTERDLADAIYQFGEERFSRRIARADRRSASRDADRHHRTAGGDRPPRRAAPRLPAHRSGDAHVSGAAHLGQPRARRSRSVSSPRAVRRLRAGARLVVITFHSLEDRIVKHTLRALQQRDGLVQVLTKKPMVAGDDEAGAEPARPQRQASCR